MDTWTIIKLLSWAESYFKKHSIESPRLTGELLLAHCFGVKRLDLYLQHDRPLTKKELSQFKLLIQKRIQNQPLAYITGKKGFYESDFKVTNDVLIPRPDTETLVEQALQILNQRQQDQNSVNRNVRKILELGTGSGAIIVSLAKESPENTYFACDYSLNAVKVAQENSKNIIGDKIHFFCSNWFSSLETGEKFDLIISNPPYIPSSDILQLAPEIKNFEPILALDGGMDGLDSFRAILLDAYRFLSPGGVILLEMGFDQKEGLLDIINKSLMYKSVKFIKDLANHNRVAVIKKNN